MSDEPTSVAFGAMTFAKLAHADQKRKYTGNPYFEHLAEVVGIAMSVGWHSVPIHPDKFMAVAWLHDCMEDQGISWAQLEVRFGKCVADGVLLLSDLEVGNRAKRKAASRERLACAPGWVQSIKCADLISNTGSIAQHDPEFAVVYLKEKIALLDVLTKADPRLVCIARQQVQP